MDDDNDDLGDYFPSYYWDEEYHFKKRQEYNARRHYYEICGGARPPLPCRPRPYRPIPSRKALKRLQRALDRLIALID